MKKKKCDEKEKILSSIHAIYFFLEARQKLKILKYCLLPKDFYVKPILHLQLGTPAAIGKNCYEHFENN
jgi:hypothetical protein